MDGHWAIQLSSKRDGIVDKKQTAETGSHTFRYPDILDEYEALKARFPDVNVVLIRGSAISSKPGNISLYVTIADPGGLTTRDEVLTWCKGRFPNLGKDARLNVCYPRKLEHD
ncbi:hypothetical protein [Terracoccus luteus]|uniref:Uncharacterized protein n=1 Tax=Terracoccus luteus TaxID=53356 RepID=A0A839Q2E6_9MICO|nr:hypothetical protein [Terracoccus luteus]MBB2988505.1 hypothetical protein [Terracoccus luteus]MCP2174148.1 hypothetical protein [Terracoccus luteus]